ncbi:MAG: M1 family aminopeptidase, partial [Alphaproteobacteria bacterium]|nr:M1 family aminopeptidase [Alphaproteobacteria bacterium]
MTLPASSIRHGLSLGAAWLLSASFAIAALAEDRLHHAIDLTLEPVSGGLTAFDRIEVSGRETLAIKPAPGLTINQITVDGEAISTEPENGVTWIPLPSAGEHQVEIAYGGVLEQNESRGGLSPMISSDGVFLPYGLGWLANGGAEDDRMTYLLSLDVPAPYKAVATGALLEEQETDGRYLATFGAKSPTEPPSVFVGDFRIDERRHGELRLRTYFPADRRELSPTYLDQAAGYIDLFEQKIGAYPYDGFSVIAAPLPVGLGFPGLTYVSSQILHMPFMLTRSLAHEILHNWWANGVFVDAGKGNWAEGLTTYMADYALAEAESEIAAWQMRLGWLRDFSALPAERDRPIDSFKSKGHDADQVVGYNKVAMVFHMLKRELGEDAFDAGLKGFWQTHKFKTAAWSDLKASFETAGGRGLDGFFAPWLTQTGAPALTLARAELRESSDGGYALDLEIASDSADYDLLVPVQIAVLDGIERRDVRLANGVADATIDLAERPLSVGIDQHHDLFRRLAADEAPPILRDVTLHDGTLTVIATNGSETTAELAKQLAARTLDTGLRLAEADDQAIRAAPLMLIGTSEQMAPIMAKAGVGPAPSALQGQGTARSWVAARDDAPPALVVEADDEAALSALLRPLPHYGRQ